jgi:hypothetical protein
MNIDNHMIWKQYLLQELFDNIYTPKTVVGVHTNGNQTHYPNFPQLLQAHLTNNDIHAVIMPFITSNNTEIHVTLYDDARTALFAADRHYPIHVSFHAVKDSKTVMTTKTNEAGSVVATVFSILKNFLDAYKHVVDSTTKDWTSREHIGIFT